jgi:hypothetical protein
MQIPISCLYFILNIVNNQPRQDGPLISIHYYKLLDYSCLCYFFKSSMYTILIAVVIYTLFHSVIICNTFKLMKS